MAKIIGNTTATPVAIPDWKQTDEKKADYIKNKPEVLTEEQIIELIEMHGGEGSSSAYIAKTVTLSAGGWYERSGIVYELEFQGMTADAVVEVAIYPDKNMIDEANRCGVICTQQEDGYLWFNAMYDTPTIDIKMEIVVLTRANLSTTDLLVGTGVVE